MPFPTSKANCEIPTGVAPLLAVSVQTRPDSIPLPSLQLTADGLRNPIRQTSRNELHEMTNPLKILLFYEGEGLGGKAPAFLLWHILVWPCSAFSLFSITKQQSHIAQLNRTLSFLRGVICRGENVCEMDPLHTRHLQGTCKKTLQIPFSSPSSHLCLLSANNPAFLWEDSELYAGGLGRPGRNCRAPVKPVGNVLLVAGTAVLCPLPVVPKSLLAPSPCETHSCRPALCLTSQAAALRLPSLSWHRDPAPRVLPLSCQTRGQSAAPVGVHFPPLSVQDQSSYTHPFN